MADLTDLKIFLAVLLRPIIAEAIRDELKGLHPSSQLSQVTEIGGIQLAQEITGLSRARLYTLVSNRAIPVSRKGGRLYFSRTDLLAWIAEGKRTVRHEFA